MISGVDYPKRILFFTLHGKSGGVMTNWVSFWSPAFSIHLPGNETDTGKGHDS